MSDNSVSLHRVIQAAPEKVFRAFSEPVALASWLPPYGFIAISHHFDFVVGGSYKMSFINFSTGSLQTFGGTFLQIEPNKYLKYTDQFDNPSLPGEMITSVEFKKVSCGTELKVSQKGIPKAIPAEMCYLGWQQSLEKLIKLVNIEIPDA